MTDREEQAIAVLNTLHDNPLLSDIHRQALEVGIIAIKALDQRLCEYKEYEKDLNELKEEILEEGNILVSKRDLLERFVKIDNDYSNRPWNLLQILANINILIGEEPCEDCISREDALMCLTGEWTEPTDELIHRFIRRIRKLPAITPAEKVGKWIYREDNLGRGRDGWYCNQCEHFEFWDSSLDMKSAKFNLPNFCPNCGAKMIEPQESEVQE